MISIDWLKNIFSNTKDGSQHSSILREFVYLDEVSLLSMLSSLRGEVTDSTSEQKTASSQDELKSNVGTGGPLPIKSEISSRYQTSNSSTIQTSRKATVQSWFREFYNQPNLRMIEPKSDIKQEKSIQELLSNTDSSILKATTELQRGELVEFKVRMEADPVFRLGTMATEFTGMASDFPELFDAQSALTKINEAAMVNKILQRLLAGLIPIRAKAIDYSVINIQGIEYITHNDAIKALDVERKPLEIVGVTEHLAYWRDIRRVLFSEAEYTMLCRIAKNGVHSSWTPVKLAELFLPIAPDLVDKISSASRTPFEQNQRTKGERHNHSPTLEKALHHYKDSILNEQKMRLNPTAETEISDIIISCASLAETATGQKKAFSTIYDYIHGLTNTGLSPERDLELREASRNHSGLNYFPSKTEAQLKDDDPTGIPNNTSNDETRLLDVEVISIYW